MKKEFGVEKMLQSLNQAIKLLNLEDKKCFVTWSKTTDVKKCPLNCEIKNNVMWRATNTNSRTWSTYTSAVSLIGTEQVICGKDNHKKNFIVCDSASIDGIGIEFNIEQFGVIGIDIDHCVEDGNINQIGRELLDNVEGLAEFSTSGNGLHIYSIVPVELRTSFIELITSVNPRKEHKAKDDTDSIICDIKTNTDTHIELYASGKYFATTGDWLYHEGDKVKPITENTIEFLREFIAKHRIQESKKETAKATTTTPQVKVKTLKNDFHTIEGMRAYLDKYHIHYQEYNDNGDVKFSVLCPNHQEHTDTKRENGEGIENGIVTFVSVYKNKPVFKCSHAHCEGLKFLDFREFVEQRKIYFFPVCNDEGAPRTTVKENLNYYFEKNKIQPKKNEITHLVELWGDGKRAGVFEDHTTTNIKSELAKIGYNISKNNLWDLINAIAIDNTYNPVIDWLKTLIPKNDGVDYCRLLFDILGADSSLYPYFYKWCLQGVYMLHNEGDYTPVLCLILKGNQGIGKSNFIIKYYPQELADYVLKEQSITNREKDDVIRVTASVLCELSEMGRTLKDQDRLKQFITTSMDVFRAPYDRLNSYYPRKTNFVGTINDNSFFSDNTGNRRFVVLDIPQAIDRDRINAFWRDHRADLHAQLYKDFDEGVDYTLTYEEIQYLNNDNEKYRIINEIEQYFLDTYDFTQPPQGDWLTAKQILMKAYNKTLGYKSINPFPSLKDVCPRATLAQVGRVLTALTQQQLLQKRVHKGTSQYKLPPLNFLDID